MESSEIVARLAAGRTDLIFELLGRADWMECLRTGSVRPLQWLVYYGDVTALRAVLQAGGDLDSIDVSEELRHAAFFGHWKMCDFLIEHGAEVGGTVEDTGETALHGALAKAGRGQYLYVVRLLLERGADPNAATIPGRETGAFMRDVRTKGETPLHRAAAYGDAATLRCLLDHGAEVEARDVHGDSPLSWASEHLRPGEILQLLQHGEHRISDRHVAHNTSDHGAGWGNAMERSLLGEYLPLSGDGDLEDGEP